MAQTLWDKIYTNILYLFISVSELILNLFNNVGFNTRNRAKLPKSLEGKVAVITGANSGIGKVTATTFAKLGASVVMACRDSEKSRKCLDQICSQLSEENKKNVSLVNLDLSSLESVRSCANEINSSVSKIDYLINNAGVFMVPESKSKDGYELHIATNHLGHFLLTQLLLDKIKAAPSARIITIASTLYMSEQLNLANINLTGEYGRLKAYSHSKLANILFSSELAKRLKGTNVTTYAVHPGVIATNIVRHVQQGLNQIVNYIFDLIIKVFYIDEELGAQTTLYCAFDEKLKQESGFYYSNCGRVKYMTSNALNDQDATKLWDLSLELCNQKKNN